MKRIAALGAIVALTACVSAEQAQNNRQARLANQFPDPADRVGMHILIQFDDEFMVQYIPSQVSCDVVLQRMNQWCQKAGLGTTAVVADDPRLRAFTEELPGGQIIQGQSVMVACTG